MPRYNRQEDFEAGIELITPYFESLGYSCAIAAPQRDMEGIFFSARFSSGLRSVELHHLYSLGPVIYTIRDHSIEHTAYLETLGVASQARYPSSGDDSRSGYAALLLDLKSLLSPFFSGPEEAFVALASPYMIDQDRKCRQESQLLEYWGSQEAQLKARARELFKQKQFAEVRQIAAQIHFPDFLTKPEQLMFSLARKHMDDKRDA